MKKILLFLSLSSSLFVFGQIPTSTKKWNDTFKRYEYYDQRGNLVGYEKYNSSSRQWEYYSQNNDYRKRQTIDLEYPTISSSDIEYAKSVAYAEAARKKQVNAVNREKNQRAIQDKYDELYARIKSFNISKQSKDNFIDEFNSKVEIADGRFPYLESPYMANHKMNFIIDSFNELLEKYVNGPNRK